MLLLPLRWFLVLLGVFLVSLDADLFISAPGSAPAISVDSRQATSAADFLTEVAAGELSAGTITYRVNAAGLADLAATRVQNGGASAIQATARLTDADISILRRNHFTEDDAAGVEKGRPASWRERSEEIAHSTMETWQCCTLDRGIFSWARLISAPAKHRFPPISCAQRPPDVRFSSVAGCDEAKDEVLRVVEFLKDPARFRTTGGRMPKGVLLVGPPGTGKTMLAKAVAGEARAHFFSLSGSDFVELYVGVGASRVRSLFKKARKMAPSIIFIDEIDAIGRQRSASDGGGAQLEHDQTLNALLVEMDGFESEDAVVVFGATNRPIPWTARYCVPAASIARSPSACPTWQDGSRSSRCTPARSNSMRASICTRSLKAHRAFPAPIWPTYSMKERSTPPAIGAPRSLCRSRRGP